MKLINIKTRYKTKGHTKCPKNYCKIYRTFMRFHPYAEFLLLHRQLIGQNQRHF